MKNVIIIILVLIILGGAGWYYSNRKTVDNDEAPRLISEDPIKAKENLIRLNSPKSNEFVQSPLLIEGEARGTWYFEASFPVSLYDGFGNLLARAPAEAQGEWMTTEFVPFKAGLKFDLPKTDTGFLVLEKDNPSGLPEHANELRVPVKFK